MTNIGKNMKVTLSEDVRDEVRSVYEGVFGAQKVTPKPDLDVYVFGDRQIGFYFAQEVLPRAQHLLGVWLEFEVDDVAATTKALAEVGVTPFEYFDKEHPYFQDPGGLVFRLAKS